MSKKEEKQNIVEVTYNNPEIGKGTLKINEWQRKEFDDLAPETEEIINVKVKILKDSLGNKLYPGDVLLEYGRGSVFGPGNKRTYSLVLWEMIYPFDGYGINYDIDGQAYAIAWRSPIHSIKVNFDDFPPEFKYSFYHGMRDLNTTVSEGTLKERIENSDWESRKVTPDDVKKRKT